MVYFHVMPRYGARMLQHRRAHSSSIAAALVAAAALLAATSRAVAALNDAGAPVAARSSLSVHPRETCTFERVTVNATLGAGQAYAAVGTGSGNAHAQGGSVARSCEPYVALVRHADASSLVSAAVRPQDLTVLARFAATRVETTGDDAGPASGVVGADGTVAVTKDGPSSDASGGGGGGEGIVAPTPTAVQPRLACLLDEEYCTPKLVSLKVEYLGIASGAAPEPIPAAVGAAADDSQDSGDTGDATPDSLYSTTLVFDDATNEPACSTAGDLARLLEFDGPWGTVTSGSWTDARRLRVEHRVPQNVIDSALTAARQAAAGAQGGDSDKGAEDPFWMQLRVSVRDSAANPAPEGGDEDGGDGNGGGAGAGEVAGPAQLRSALRVGDAGTYAVQLCVPAGCALDGAGATPLAHGTCEALDGAADTLVVRQCDAAPVAFDTVQQGRGGSVTSRAGASGQPRGSGGSSTAPPQQPVLDTPPPPFFEARGTLALGGTRGLKLQDHALPIQGGTGWAMSFWLWLDDDGTHDNYRTLFYKGPLNEQRTPSAWLTPHSRNVCMRASTVESADLGRDSLTQLPERRWVHVAFSFANDTYARERLAELDPPAGADADGSAAAVDSETGEGGDDADPDGATVAAADPMAGVTLVDGAGTVHGSVHTAEVRREQAELRELLAGVADTTEYRYSLYVDGVEDLTLHYADRVLPNDGPLMIGKDPSFAGLKGLVSWLKIYAEPLSGAAVLSEYQATRPAFIGNDLAGPSSARDAQGTDADARDGDGGDRDDGDGGRDGQHSSSADGAGMDRETRAMRRDFAAVTAAARVMDSWRAGRSGTGMPAFVPRFSRDSDMRGDGDDGDDGSEGADTHYGEAELTRMTAQAKATLEDCDADAVLALDQLETAADAGHVPAMYEAAMLLLFPNRRLKCGDRASWQDAGIVSRDVTRARAMLETAAASGHGPATLELAYLVSAGVASAAPIGDQRRLLAPTLDAATHGRGSGSTDDDDSRTREAGVVEVIAANAGATAAPFESGGRGTADGALGGRVSQLAIGLFHIAAAAGQDEAYLALGHAYNRGRGVARDVETAAFYYSYASVTAYKSYHTPGNQPLNEMQRLTADNEDTIEVGQRGDDDELIQYSILQADQGHVPSMVAVADLYYYGARGLPRDQARAFEYFHRAAQAGDPGAQVATGNLYLKGEGVAASNVSAVEWYNKAAQHDPPPVRALNGLGFAYYFGRGVELNQTKAFEYFERAAAQETDGDSLFNAGQCLQRGAGVPKDVAAAMRYFKRAVELFGHFDSIYEVGLMHAGGVANDDGKLLVPRHSAEALRYLRPAAMAGEWGGGVRDGFDLYLHGDYDGAALKYLRAIDMGYEAGGANVAYLLDKGRASYSALTGAPRRCPRCQLVAARHAYEFSLAEGGLDSALKLGDYHYYGLGGLQPSAATAVRLYSRASAAGSAQAAYNLAVMNEYGFAVEPPLQQAALPRPRTGGGDDDDLAGDDDAISAYRAMPSLPAQDAAGSGEAATTSALGKPNPTRAAHYYNRALKLNPHSARVPVQLALARMNVRSTLVEWGAPEWLLKATALMPEDGSPVPGPLVSSAVLAARDDVGAEGDSDGGGEGASDGGDGASPGGAGSDGDNDDDNGTGGGTAGVDESHLSRARMALGDMDLDSRDSRPPSRHEAALAWVARATGLDAFVDGRGADDTPTFDWDGVAIAVFGALLMMVITLWRRRRRRADDRQPQAAAGGAAPPPAAARPSHETAPRVVAAAAAAAAHARAQDAAPAAAVPGAGADTAGVPATAASGNSSDNMAQPAGAAADSEPAAGNSDRGVEAARVDE